MFIHRLWKNEQDVDNVAYVKTQKVAFGQNDVENSYSGSVKGRYETQLAFQVMVNFWLNI